MVKPRSFRRMIKTCMGMGNAWFVMNADAQNRPLVHGLSEGFGDVKYDCHSTVCWSVDAAWIVISLALRLENQCLFDIT